VRRNDLDLILTYIWQQKKSERATPPKKPKLCSMSKGTDQIPVRFECDGARSLRSKVFAEQRRRLRLSECS
jgi:hypothetical protein